MPPLRRGAFITLEGGEGAGKSTQAARLRQRLAASDVPCIVTREPGGSARAELIRDVVLAGRIRKLGPFAETLLFAAARADHVDRAIRPALAAGTFVICDRFIDSTRVYQGILGGIGQGLIAALERISLRATGPDLTLVLDLPAELGVARAGRRRDEAGIEADRFEAEELGFHTAIRDGFLWIAAQEPDRCVVVDAGGGADEAEALIWAAVESRLLASDARRRENRAP